jgi:aspartyl-tRNA synthetase
MDCKEIKVLSSSKPLPFAIPDSKEVSESLRLKYRFLDLRSLQTRDAIVKRHQIISYMRTFFDQKDFIEIETPILGK